MADFYLMCGMSGAGKTTFAREYAKANNLRYISIDQFYNAFFGDENTHIHEFDVWMAFYRAIELAGRDGVSVIVDTNSPTRSNREEMYNWFHHMFYNCYLIFVDALPSVCCANNLQRKRQVPEQEMANMLKRFERPRFSEKSLWREIYEVDNIDNSFSEMKEMFY